MIITIIILAVLILWIANKIGYQMGRQEEAKKWFNKCEKCNKDGVCNVGEVL